MAKFSKVSRYGLTVCPKCRTHVQVDALQAQGGCPFCQSRPGTGAIARTLAATGRSGLIAASLMGLSMGPLAGCDPGDSSPPVKGDTITVDTNTGQDGSTETGGDTAADTAVDSTTPDIPIQPPYGIPPEPDTNDEGPESDAPDTSDGGSQDLGPQPAYGIPPQEEE